MLASTVNIIVNGDVMYFPDGQPYINEDNRTMVPIRFISEQLGADVSWDEVRQTVNISYNQSTISIPLGKKLSFVDGKEIELDTNAVIENGRTMVPLRFVSEALGAEVLYSSTELTVRISTNTHDLKSTQTRNNMYKSAPKMAINTQKHYSALVDTNRGSFTLELFAAQTPITVNNFVFLARAGYYNGISFHRIIKEFMIQTGDPMGNGTGSPGYTFADELPPLQSYAPGIVAMANCGPNTNGSQFFICTGNDSASLNSQPNYTVFGRIINGMNVILKIADTPVGANARGEISQPLEEIYIKNITITEK